MISDGLRNALDEALPRGEVPFQLDGSLIIAAGRRLRRRRRWATAGAATLGVVMVAMLLPAVLSGASSESAPSAGALSVSTLQEGWSLRAQDPFTTDETRRATRAFTDAVSTYVPYVELSRLDDNAVEFGRYVETSPDGTVSRDIFLASGLLSPTVSGVPTGFQIAVLPIGSGDDTDEFIECGIASGATCGPMTGRDMESILFSVEQVDSNGGAVIEQFNVVVARPDTSVVEMLLYPIVEGGMATVTEPVISPGEVVALVSAIPQKLDV